MCFLCCFFISDALRTFLAFKFAYPMTQKLFNLVKEWKKYWKMFGDRYMFVDGQFYFTSLRMGFWFFHGINLILQKNN
jgi:hypothetical protein